MSYKLCFYDHLLVNGIDVDEEIDESGEAVNLRRGLTPAQVFEAGRRFGEQRSNRIIDVNLDEHLSS